MFFVQLNVGKSLIFIYLLKSIAFAFMRILATRSNSTAFDNLSINIVRFVFFVFMKFNFFIQRIEMLLAFKKLHISGRLSFIRKQRIVIIENLFDLLFWNLILPFNFFVLHSFHLLWQNSNWSLAYLWLIAM